LNNITETDRADGPGGIGEPGNQQELRRILNQKSQVAALQHRSGKNATPNNFAFTTINNACVKT